LQKRLEAYNAQANCGYKLAISVGVTRYDPKNPCSVDELLARADTLMYERKRGRQKP
jgi:PleD family two-component response regulator